MSYVYFVYGDVKNTTSITNFHGKIGKGSGDRYKCYVTPYGSEYIACILYHNKAFHMESYIQKWCRKEGYMKEDTETIYMDVLDTDTIVDCRKKFHNIICKIIYTMRLIGPIISCDRYGNTLNILPQIVECIEKPIHPIPKPTPHVSQMLIPEYTVTDRSQYKRLIDPLWDKELDMFEKVWMTKKRVYIENLIYAYREQEKYIEIKNSIVSLFNIGGVSFDDAIQKRDKITLHYSGNDRDKVSTVLSHLVEMYPDTKVSRCIWSWMNTFFCDKLLLNSKMKESKRTRDTRHYCYELDMSDWIWYHIMK